MSDYPSDYPVPLSKALRQQPATRLQIEELGDRLQDVEAKMDQLGEKVDALTELIHKAIQYHNLSERFGTMTASYIMKTHDTLKDDAASAASAATAAPSLSSEVRENEGASD